MRWADLDLLGHVNNVVYADYLQEARVDLLRAMMPGRDHLGEAIVVVRHEVTYLAPLLLRPEPVAIECWVTHVRAASFTVAYEIYDEVPDDLDPGVPPQRRVYLRASTVLAPFDLGAERPRRLSDREREVLARFTDEPAGDPAPRIPRVDRERAHRFPLTVRFSDVDLYRHVNNVVYFDYLQESRIRMLDEVVAGLGVPRPHIVTAQTDVDYLRPVVLREEPYDVWTQVTRVGTRSMTVTSEIADHVGDGVAARARVALVFFDVDAGRAIEPPAVLRERLLEQVAGQPG
jgi:acyl-CoA thioester hydrolase